MNIWHYSKDGQQLGPVSVENIRALIKNKEIPVDALVWKQGMSDWNPANTIPELHVSAEQLASTQSPTAASPYAAPVTAQPMSSYGLSGAAGGPMPTTFLWQSIVVTLCCCPPFGIVSIVFAAQVSSKYQLGDYEGARNCSKNAKLWMLISLGVFAFFFVLQFFGSFISAFAR